MEALGNVHQNTGADPLCIGTSGSGHPLENAQNSVGSGRWGTDRPVVDRLIEELQLGSGKDVGLVQLWAVGGFGDLDELGPRQSCDQFSALVLDSR